VPANEIKRLNWALEAYARSAKAMMRARTIEEMAEQVCRAVVERESYVVAAIALSEPAPDCRIRFIARAGKASDYVDGLKLSWDPAHPFGNGPGGRAIRSGVPVVTNDTQLDPSFDPWRERARGGGIGSLVVVPFGWEDGRAIGAVHVFADAANNFLPREVQIFEELGEELLFAMGVIADQQKLEAARHAQAAAEAESRRRQAELSRIARVLTVGEFAASISHEITQPLAATITNIETALRYLAPASGKVDDARAALERALRDAERATAVIRETRRQIARGDAEFAPCDLNRIVAEILETAQESLHLAEVSVHSELASGPLPVLGSAIQLEQVIVNLLMNARDALQETTGRERRMEIRSFRESDGGSCVTVLDNGAGMSKETRDRVFDHFFTTKQTGMGMGLAISRSIVEAHGGTLWCEAAETGGTRFCMRLPAASGVHDD